MGGSATAMMQPAPSTPQKNKYSFNFQVDRVCPKQPLLPGCIQWVPLPDDTPRFILAPGKFITNCY
jgi:hypothetical protein